MADFGSVFGEMAETGRKFLGEYALQTIKEGLQQDSLRLQNELATGRLEKEQAFRREETASTQAFQTKRDEAQMASSEWIAKLSSSTQYGVNAMNNAAMKEVRAAQAAEARANTERLGLDNDQKRLLAAAQNEVLNAKDEPTRNAALEKHYFLNPAAAESTQRAALLKSQTQTADLENKLKFEAQNAREQMQAYRDAGEPEKAEKLKEKLDLYDSMGAEHRARTAGYNAENRTKVITAQMAENSYNLKMALQNATTDEQRAAAQKAIDLWEYSPKEARAEIAAWQAQAKLAETAMNHANIRLQQETDRGGDPGTIAMLRSSAETYAREMITSQNQARIGLWKLNPGAAAGAANIDVSAWITDPAKAAAEKAKADGKKVTGKPEATERSISGEGGRFGAAGNPTFPPGHSLHKPVPAIPSIGGNVGLIQRQEAEREERQRRLIENASPY